MFNNRMYEEDIQAVCSLQLPWEKLNNSKVLITGATGMLGKFLVDVLMERNRAYGQTIKLVLNGRDKKKLINCFSEYKDKVEFWEQDLCLELSYDSDIDYICHFAAVIGTQYSKDYPIQATQMFTQGMLNICEFGVQKKIKKLVNLSSIRVYGDQSYLNIPFFVEDGPFGGFDCSDLEYIYFEGKRTSEMIGTAYFKQHGLPITNLRLCKTVGATCDINSDAVFHYFAVKAAKNEKIELRSAGTQLFSYAYIADSVAGILFCLLKGKEGEAYNLGDATNEKTTTLKEYVTHLHELFGTEVVFSGTVDNSCNTPEKQVSYSGKLEKLGWKKMYSVREGLRRTVLILRDVYFKSTE